MRPLRILHVIGNLRPDHGGPAKACLDMSAALARLGHQVTLLASDWRLNSDVTADLEAGSGRSSFDLRLTKTTLGKPWPVSLEMATELSELLPRMDLVHLHSLYLSHVWMTVRACRHFGVPYLARPHGTLESYIRRRSRAPKLVADVLFQRRALREATAIHYTSRAEFEDAPAWLGKRPSIVVPLGVDPAPLADGDAEIFRAAFPQLAGKKLILFLGRLHQKKGFDLLLPAFAELASAFPDWHLVLAGPDAGAGRWIEAWRRSSGLAGRVLLAGELRGEMKASAYAAADFFVLPSYSENFALAVVEALATGTPVLVSDHVAIAEDVSASGAGLVVSCHRSDLARALASLMREEELRLRLASKARACAAQFSLDAMGKALEAAYRNLLVASRS